MNMSTPDFFCDVLTAMSIGVVIIIAYIAMSYDARSAAGRRAGASGAAI